MKKIWYLFFLLFAFVTFFVLRLAHSLLSGIGDSECMKDPKHFGHYVGAFYGIFFALYVYIGVAAYFGLCGYLFYKFCWPTLWGSMKQDAGRWWNAPPSETERGRAAKKKYFRTLRVIDGLPVPEEEKERLREQARQTMLQEIVEGP